GITASARRGFGAREAPPVSFRRAAALSPAPVVALCGGSLQLRRGELRDAAWGGARGGGLLMGAAHSGSGQLRWAARALSGSGRPTRRRGAGFTPTRRRPAPPPRPCLCERKAALVWRRGGLCGRDQRRGIISRVRRRARARAAAPPHDCGRCFARSA